MVPSRRVVLRSATAAMIGGTVLTACRKPRGQRTDPPPSPAPAPVEDPDEPLVVGSIGTQVGLEGIFEQQIAVAVAEGFRQVDIGGGVFGQDLTVHPRHVITAPDEDLSPVVDELAAAGASAVVVSCSEDQLAAAMPAFVAAGIAVVSVTSTAMALRSDEAGTGGMLVRLLPDDVALATQLVEQSDGGQGPGVIALVAPESTSGHGMADALHHVIDPAGGTVHEVLYAPDALDPAGIAAAALGAGATQIVIDGGPETRDIIGQMVDQSRDERGNPALRTPIRTLYYGSRPPGDALPAKLMATVTGTRPGGPPPDELLNIMLRINTGFAPDSFEFGGVAFDAATLIALGAQTAHSAEGARIVEAIAPLLVDGDDVSSYEQALAAMREGTDIRYAGMAGDIELDTGKDPARATISTVSYDDANGVASTNGVAVIAPE